MKYAITDKRILPEHMTPSTKGANSIDLRACIEAPITLDPGEQHIVSCGISVEIPHEGMGTLLPRSGQGVRGLVLGNLVGNIDPDYRGEVKACLWNRSDTPITVEPMDRIAQLVVVATFHPTWLEVQDLSDTDRGTGGFGSTGSS